VDISRTRYLISPFVFLRHSFSLGIVHINPDTFLKTQLYFNLYKIINLAWMGTKLLINTLNTLFVR